MGIYSDLFPGVEVPQPDRAELLKCIKKELDKRNLQATEWYLEKIIQVSKLLKLTSQNYKISFLKNRVKYS